MESNGIKLIFPPEKVQKRVWADIEVNLDGVDLKHFTCQNLELKARIPLLLSSEKYGMPNTKQFLESDTLWLKEWLILSGLIRPGDSGEDILKIARDSCLGSIYMVPQADPKIKSMEAYMKFFAIGLLTDDTLETSNILGRNKSFYVLLPELAKKIIEGKFKSIEELPTGYPILQPLLKTLFISSQELRSTLPNYDDRMKPYIDAAMDTLVGMCQLLLLRNEKEELSEGTFLYLRRYDIGSEPFIELAAIILGVDLEPEVRNSLLFRRAMDLACQICCLMNDMIGLKKDILENNSSLVLFKARKEDISISEAFEQVAEVIRNNIIDLKYTCHQIKKFHNRSQDVSEYVTILKQFVDGFMYWTSTNRARYGEGWVSVNIYGD